MEYLYQLSPQYRMLYYKPTERLVEYCQNYHLSIKEPREELIKQILFGAPAEFNKVLEAETAIILNLPNELMRSC